MKTFWIVENFVKESSYTELIQEIKKQDFPLSEILGDYKHSDLDIVPYDNPCIFQGSIQLSKIIKDKLKNRNNYPILFCTFENYQCSKYYFHYGQKLFNDKYCLISLKELGRQRFLFYGIFGKEGLIFIRPDSGDKPFQADLLDILDLDRFLIKHKDIENELILISTPKTIRGEWRFVVTKYKEILGYSLYKYQDQITKIPSAPPQAISFVNDLLKIEYYPDSVFVIDVCEDNEGKFYLLELNSFSSAGLYACKKELIVKRVSEIALEEFNNLNKK